jgi:excinuclease ABC subunit C
MLAQVAALPHEPGVYRFRGPGGRVLYVGRAVDLRRRVATYWGELRDRRHLRRMVPRIERLEAVVCDSGHEAAWLERNLIEHRLPSWNRSRGEEVPVYVRVDGRPRSPGIAVVHRVVPATGVVHFGPYLGSVRAKAAVAGLERILPLAYAGVGLSGSHVDLARVRGVGATDRGALLDTLHRVLGREPAAVAQLRDALCALRDGAAGTLAYERAGQVQAELEALEWLVSPQRMTSMDPVSADVAGWSDGILVRFQILDGRLRAWSQRPCSRAGARSSVVATPPAWAGFAERNARLAARLSASQGVDAFDPV